MENVEQMFSRLSAADQDYLIETYQEYIFINEATTTGFIDTYCKCQKEIWELGPRIRGARPDSNGQRNAIGCRLERSQKILDIRKKYYAEYGKFLTEPQIERVYQLEKEMMDRLSRRCKNKGVGSDKKNRRGR